MLCLLEMFRAMVREDGIYGMTLFFHKGALFLEGNFGSTLFGSAQLFNNYILSCRQRAFTCIAILIK